MNERIFIKGQARIYCRTCDESWAEVQLPSTPLYKLEDVAMDEVNSFPHWHDGVCGICRDAELRDQAECEKADAQRKEDSQ